MEKNKIGVLAFIASEATFFILLIIAYVYYQILPANGPTAATSLDPLTTGVFSLFLFASSFTVWRAGKSLSAGNRRAFSTWLIATFLLGIIFLAGQGAEWSRLIAAHTTISTNRFGTTFFTLTGFHGAHVLIGLLALAIMASLAITGNIQGTQSAGVEAISLYWHFVDVVWVVIYGVIYLQLLLARL